MRLAFPLLVAIATASSFALGNGMDLSDPEQAELCASLTLITQAIAEESHAKNVPGRTTNAFRAISHLGASAEALAQFSDDVRGKLAPSLVGAWSKYGLCLGWDSDVLTGPAAEKVGHACNSAPEGTSHTCISRFLEETFDALPADTQRRALDAAGERGY